MATTNGEDSHPPVDGPESSLGDQFLHYLKSSKFDTKQEFLPEGYLDSLITRDALKDDLFFEKAVLDSKDESMIDFINTSAKKVFATAYCVLGNGGSTLLATMGFFQSLGYSDKDLLIEEPQAVDLPRNSQAEPPSPFNRIRDRALRKEWAPMRIRNFFKTRWMFLSPVFSRDQFHHVLSPNVVLPFVWVNNVIKEGRFSKVYEVEIHEDHQKLLDCKADGSPPHVAIKEILTTDNDEDVRQKIEANFNLEASALSDIASLEHEHIIERIAAITIDKRHYFMFQWADGGNLREFWKENPRPHLTPELIRQSVYQLRGLADALMALHHYKDEANYRHGDLKPENVLRFKDNTFVGHFKIADMGLAKRHTQVTAARGDPTSTIYGTTRYEPPETSTNPLEARSRLYDVWSLGCIILEYIIWLLYGYEKLLEFSNDIQIETGCFYLVERGGDRPKAKVHPTVVTWMNKISSDPECSAQTAIRDLLSLVRDKLLVVALLTERDTGLAFDPEFVSVTSADSPSDPVPAGSSRARAQIVNSALHAILSRGETDENYLLTSKTRLEFESPSTTHRESISDSLKVPEQHKSKPPGPYENGSINSKDYPTSLVKNIHLNHIWDFYSDNIFANKIVQYCDQQGFKFNPTRFESLCHRCERLDFMSSSFRVPDTVLNLAQKAKSCGFCRLLSHACQKAGVSGHIRLQRIGSTLRIDDVAAPLLSIVRNPGGLSTSPSIIQVGYPNLSPPRHRVHFETIRQWIQDCDNTPGHENCQSAKDFSLPTRLLDVQDSTIRLVGTENLHCKYLALSHPWGDSSKHSHFCTYNSNIKKHQRGIDFGSLPQTFQDAITVTRELKFRYLWIDSLCIIQGSDGDFTEQSKLMEEVFSSAYCVLAASRAAGQGDGFLGDRSKRDYITFSRDAGDTYHICEEIDDFQGDVIDGALNQRGWVLQERALARRTVYFTEKQTYWECGGGIRCETFTKMKNNIAAFLGDPRFPEVAMNSTRGERIFLYQMFYDLYSKLQFSKTEDRPFAIAGLEKRLIRGFGAEGGYGIIDDRKGLLHRSLLWRRASGGTLQKIDFPPERNIFVPTWSWMAYEGGIDYLIPIQDGIEWEQNDVRSPWSEDSPPHYPTEKNSKVSLDVKVRAFDMEDALKAQITLHFDIPEKGGYQTPGLKCVVLASPKTTSTTADRRWYVLLVAPKSPKGFTDLAIFERVGVGRIPKSCILQSEEAVKLQ